MSLLNQFIKNVHEQHWFDRETTVVLAVSTGVDSMVMLNLFLRSNIKGLRIIVAYVDHHLRPASVEETTFIKEYCAQHHVELQMKEWPAEVHPKVGIEAAAREFRYGFFAEIMDQFKADYVATAHHADDLAETMVMKLVRGGRLNSLVGIAPERQFGNGKLIRPMLSFGKFEIRQYANDNTLKWFEDETNQNDENLRNRIRHHVMPQLKEENPLAIKHMVDYSKQLIKMITVSNHYIDNLLSGMVGDKHELDITNFNDFDDSLWTLLIQRWLEQFPKSVAVSNDQLTQIVRLINNPLKAQGEVDLNSQITVAKRYGKLVILNKSKKSFSTYQKNVDFMVPLNRWNQIEGGRSFGVFTHAPDNITPGIKIHELLLTEADFPLIYRHPKPGDRFEIENGGHQKVARFLINQKITTDDRKRIQLLVSNTDNVLAVLGYRVAKSSGNQDTNKYYLIEK